MHAPEPLDVAAAHDLGQIASELRQDDAYERTGHVARTLVRTPDLRVVVVAVRAGHRIADHQAGATATIQVIYGVLRLQLADRQHEIGVGQLLAIEPGARHDVEARSDSAFTLTLGWSPETKNGAT